MSFADITIFAPSCALIKFPIVISLNIEPGKTYTSLFCSNAQLVVIEVPLLIVDSVIKTPFDKPLINLFLSGK